MDILAYASDYIRLHQITFHLNISKCMSAMVLPFAGVTSSVPVISCVSKLGVFPMKMYITIMRTLLGVGGGGIGCKKENEIEYSYISISRLPHIWIHIIPSMSAFQVSRKVIVCLNGGRH